MTIDEGDQEARAQIEIRRPASAPRLKAVLLLLLAVTAGATDATAFTRIGHVFASVITGNLVLLGLSAAGTDSRVALFAGCAIGGYALGVILAAPQEAKDDADRAVWPMSATVALGGELALLIAFAVAWEIDGRAPARAAQIPMLVLCAVAMGIQSTAVRRVGQASTTYLTSTLTGLFEAVAARRWGPSQAQSLGILVALVCGAAAAATLISHARAWLPVVQLLPLMIVEAAGLWLMRSGPRDAANMTAARLPE